MKKTLLTVALIALGVSGGECYGQFWRDLGNAAKNAAESSVKRNVEKKVEDGVDKAFDADTYRSDEEETSEKKTEKKAEGWKCSACGTEGNTGKFCNECGAKKPEGDGSWVCTECGTKGNKGKFCNECGAKKPGGESAAKPVEPAKPAKPQAATTSWNRYDFVAGDEIIFEDDVVGEQVGEIPSKWNVNEGDSEVARVDGEEVICLFEACIEPLMKNPNNYLTDKFTLEFDFYEPIRNEGASLNLLMHTPERDDHSYYWNEQFNFHFYIGCDENTYENYNGKPEISNTVRYTKKNEQNFSSDSRTVINYNGWNHLAMSYNQGTIKIYINEDRVVNCNQAKQYSWFCLLYNGNRENPLFIKNVRLAKGAVPLYNRLVTDGKIVSYGITFATGKADLKPESMGEINRIAKLMKENGDLKFEVQGHCDNTGSDKVNDPLSQKRAEAIVDAIVAQGIDRGRLTAVGKGSHSPIADNSTEEGKAKNRRVEFVKK